MIKVMIIKLYIIYINLLIIYFKNCQNFFWQFFFYLRLSENTNQDIEKLKRGVERDYFMEADEAKEYGIVDEVIVRHGK